MVLQISFSKQSAQQKLKLLLSKFSIENMVEFLIKNLLRNIFYEALSIQNFIDCFQKFQIKYLLCILTKNIF